MAIKTPKPIQSQYLYLLKCSRLKCIYRFVHTQKQITHVWSDEMQRTIEDHKDHDELRGCFYKGRVRTDDRSAVAVSLCDGMVSDKH